MGSQLSVTSRDELAERINNAEIRAENSAENNGNNNPRCVVIPSIPLLRHHATFSVEGWRIRLLACTSLEHHGGGERNMLSDTVLACRDFFWDLLSLHSQEEQMELEQSAE
ncbi:uncharacterized protein AKAME5_001960000 [Lates japonicus]|uniref:Uncharacterized protein n=1 Tax=Lates japonicus TaxID=270547 RepID=A0AAD3N9L0_LATJO|nr:uncharacterized protein AKAME5_001960000 [Lates japonicus]